MKKTFCWKATTPPASRAPLQWKGILGGALLLIFTIVPHTLPIPLLGRGARKGVGWSFMTSNITHDSLQIRHHSRQIIFYIHVPDMNNS